jgi:hypothetical protein
LAKEMEMARKREEEQAERDKAVYGEGMRVSGTRTSGLLSSLINPGGGVFA